MTQGLSTEDILAVGDDPAIWPQLKAIQRLILDAVATAGKSRKDGVACPARTVYLFGVCLGGLLQEAPKAQRAEMIKAIAWLMECSIRQKEAGVAKAYDIDEGAN